MIWVKAGWNDWGFEGMNKKNINRGMLRGLWFKLQARSCKA